MEEEEDTISMERTLLLIKPDGMQNRDEIVRRVIDANFVVLQTRTIRLTPEQSREFYKNKISDPNFASMVKITFKGFLSLPFYFVYRQIHLPKDPLKLFVLQRKMPLPI